VFIVGDKGSLEILQWLMKNNFLFSSKVEEYSQKSGFGYSTETFAFNENAVD
jgi:hypothetical protein